MPRVALLIETTRTYSRDILQGVRRFIDTHAPWSCFIELRALETETPEWIRCWRGDGILTRTFTQEMADLITATSLPAVELRSTDLDHSFPFVGMDNRLIGQSVAEHFLTRGYRNFGIYSLGCEMFFRERNEKFKSAIEAADCQYDELVTEESTAGIGWEDEQQRLMKWLHKIPTPAGLFATNDSLAVRVLEACQRAGIRVPEEIAVVGTENEETLCSFAQPPLTSVVFDGETVGMRAAEMLDGMMRGERPEPCVYVAPKGILRRQSSDEMVLADRVIATALYMIRQEACQGLSVSDVAERLNISRSTLERRMRTAIGRAPKAEILRHRFLRVEELLRSSNKTVETIAEETGFQNPNYLHQVFRQRHGMTPNQFRQSFATS